MILLFLLNVAYLSTALPSISSMSIRKTDGHSKPEEQAARVKVPPEMQSLVDSLLRLKRRDHLREGVSQSHAGGTQDWPIESGRGTQSWRVDIPKVLSHEAASIGALKPEEAAEGVRKNVRAEQVKIDSPRLRLDFACIHYELVRKEHMRMGIPTIPFSPSNSILGEVLSHPDQRAFILRYTGPRVRIHQSEGVVELNPGNLLGIHLQRLTRLFEADYFKRLLALKRQRSSLEALYDSAIENNRERDENYRKLTTPTGDIRMESGTILRFDRFSYTDINLVDERNLGLQNPRAVFLRYISTLPNVGGMGLSEVFLDQALRHDLDVEQTRHVITFARVDGLYRKYTRRSDWHKFNLFTTLREAHILDRMPVEDQEFVVRTAMSLDHRQLQRDLEESREDGTSIYRTVRFHQNAGGQLICGVPHCARTDATSLFTGAMLLYDLEKLRLEGRI